MAPNPYRPLPQKYFKDADSERGPDVSASETDGLPVLDARTQDEVAQEVDAHVGVKRVEAAEKVHGRYSKWTLFVSLGLASYIYSLDSSTTSNYLSFAASSFGEHSLISSVAVAQSVIVIFYVVGYIVIASAQSIGTIAGGIIVYAVGLQLLTQIIIADLTTLKWRGLVSSLTSMPFVINGFIGPNISAAVLARSGWRWGYGMFAILVPATLLPLIVTLFWAERKARRVGLVDTTLAQDGVGRLVIAPAKTFLAGVRRTAGQLDLIGLVLLGAGVSLILLPLTLAVKAKNEWRNPSMIAMLVVGGVLLILFAVWDLCFASRPVIAPRFMRNRSVVLPSLIGFFDFMSFYLTYVYLYSFVLVVKPWSVLDATYFNQAQSIALTVFGFAAGVGMWYTRRYKNILVIGLVIRLLGVGLMIHSRGALANTTELVFTQILQGLGGGMAAASSQVGAQASVPHVDVAMVTAVVLLLTEIGGAVGSAIAGAIWTSTMPEKLAAALPQLSADERAALFGSITDVLQYPRGSPIREGVISAYDDTMKVMVITATGLSVVPILLALFMPNWYLGDTQNAVDAAALDGEVRYGDADSDGPVSVRD
ncbi:drug:h+ antiporter [Phellopilus nigrolimitatus]|nr:drug:h+ antiporter [Phellopilus nigrolimitatus]